MTRRGDERGDAAGEALWRFSLALYARPGVAEALLALQDRAGRDVNLMLLSLWVGAVRGRRLDAAELAAGAAALSALDRGAIRPLRALRRRLKHARDGDIAVLRRRVAALELAAERRAQRRLADLCGGAGRQEAADRLAAASTNLALYLQEEAGAAEAGVIRRALAALMRLAAPPG